ncbi:hydrogenase expression/formation protein [Oryzibacter oryziterrae]|uniref:hydrogenase expression/formation protein n=1 Tax=Oryzibacter oryziterrae TaxID=2766474 RepID=UPI001F431B19|nr:hydrogenase expression/formation protein [Oryzibacter oryziterrae]
MKAGFWVAPEGEDAAISMQPIGSDGAEIRKGSVTGTGALSFLATSNAAALIARCPAIADMLPKITAALEVQSETAPGILFDLSPLNPDEALLITEVLGEGEVAATVALPDGVVAQIQESVFAGLWRVRFTSATGELLADYAEVSAVPQAIRRAAAMTLPELSIGDAPAGLMNAMPVLTEIADRARRYEPDAPSHTISLTLLPMSPEDIEFLMASLGTGPVRIVSRGYGTCRVQATAIHNVWSVQFFNAMDTLLLDTLEIGGVPVVASAAEEDFRDSAERLREIEEAYFRD